MTSAATATAKAVYCAACGAEAPAGSDWFTVHFSARNLELLVTATEGNLRYLGEKSACSRECLIRLVTEWAEVWKARKAKRA
jgi:hypothetical protein